MRIVNKTYYYLDEKDKEKILKLFTMKSISLKTGYSVSYISKILNGKKYCPTKLIHLFKIAL